MKAHIPSKKYLSRPVVDAAEELAKSIAKQVAEKKLEDAESRIQMIYLLAMFRIGLSNRTVNRFINEVNNVTEQYGKRKECKAADYGLIMELREYGMDFDLPKNSEQ